MLIKLVTDPTTKTGKILKGQICHKAIVPDDREIIEVSWKAFFEPIIVQNNQHNLTNICDLISYRLY